jgi:hypothetical protein
MSNLEIVERVAIVKSRGGNYTQYFPQALSWDSVAPAALELLKANPEGRDRLLHNLRDQISEWPERLRPAETLQTFEALLDVVTDLPLHEWRDKWRGPFQEVADAEGD